MLPNDGRVCKGSHTTSRSIGQVICEFDDEASAGQLRCDRANLRHRSVVVLCESPAAHQRQRRGLWLFPAHQRQEQWARRHVVQPAAGGKRPRVPCNRRQREARDGTAHPLHNGCGGRQPVALREAELLQRRVQRGCGSRALHDAFTRRAHGGRRERVACRAPGADHGAEVPVSELEVPAEVKPAQARHRPLRPREHVVAVGERNRAPVEVQDLQRGVHAAADEAAVVEAHVVQAQVELPHRRRRQHPALLHVRQPADLAADEPEALEPRQEQDGVGDP
mmetsp:Transcript_32459/g.100430  ORF Transcript_32459/g.100430 Transcript_32459/m.100430 type:complete len:279 (-) Transcript_32459:1234-2070(-)